MAAATSRYVSPSENARLVPSSWREPIRASAPSSWATTRTPFTDASGAGTVVDKFSGHRSWFGTVRGRIGFTLNSYPQLMIYATGGLAYGESSRSASTTTFETDGDLVEFFPYGSISKVDI